MEGLEALRRAWEAERYDVAWDEYRCLLTAGEVDAEAHLIGSLAARQRGDLHSARRAIEQAAEAGPTGTILGRVRLQRGVVLQELGDAKAAVEQFQACIREISGIPHLRQVMEGVAWYNLGLALRETRRYEEALQAYQRAVRCFQEESMPTHLCMALHNLAWVACILRCVRVAEEALDESRSLCSTEYLLWHQRIGEAHLKALGSMDEKRQAMELCQQIIGSAGQVPGDVRSHGCWLAGLVALEVGLLEAAEDLANQAIEHAVRARGENRCLLDAADLLREVRLQAQSRHPLGA